MACVSAAGITMPPMVIFDRKTLKQELSIGEVPGTIYALTDNGWSNGEIFNIWFHNHFLTHAPAVRPLLLLLDGHSSHYNPSTLKMAAKESVIIFCLPPHCTHVAQPLDVSCFSALKRAWHQVCHQYTIDNPGKRVTRFQFSQLFSTAWLQAMTAKNVIAGFRACGVCPLDKTVFEVSACDANSSIDSDDGCGLSYVPLLTPRKKREVTRSEVTRNEAAAQNSDDTVHTFSKQSTFSKFFPIPPPPAGRSTPTKLASSKVLTSVENLRILDEKAKQKQEKEELKEQRRIQREAKAAEKKKLKTSEWI